MKYETIFVETFGNSPVIRIIDFLLDNPLFDYSKEEIVKELGMSKTTFYKYFGVIEKNNLVKITRKVGKSKMYKLDRKNKAIQKIKELVWVLGINEMEKSTNLDERSIRKPLKV